MVKVMAERRRISQSPPSKKAPAKSNKKQQGQKQKSPVSGEVWAVVVIAIGILFALGFYFDSTGAFGAGVKSFSMGLFGSPAYTLPFILILLGIFNLFQKKITTTSWWLVLGIFISLCAFIHLCSPAYEIDISSLYEIGKANIGGGLLGGLVAIALKFTGRWGTGVILSTLIIVFTMLLTGFSLSGFLRVIAVRIKERRAAQEDDVIYIHDEIPEEAPRRREEKRQRVKTEKETSAEPEFKIFTHDQVGISDAVAKDEKITAEELMKEEMQKSGPVAAETIDKEHVAAAEEEIVKEIEKAKPIPPYAFPPIDILAPKEPEKANKGKPEDLRENAKKLIDTLKSFGVEAKVLEVSRGPSVTRFEIQPSAGVKVSKIVNLADDIALNLAAFGVRIEAPIPGKAAVGIEIPNKSVSTVSLREVLGSKEFKSFKSRTAFAIGKDISGKPIISDISKMPHLLIAGTTGSGKSVCINTLIASIIYKAKPNEVRLLMIDPKVVELGVYNGIPHLLIPVVTDPRKAAGALNWAVTEMVRRYKLFADYNVRDISGYNEYAQTEGLESLEKIVIIIDELSDLMMAAPREVEDAICRLAQMARAAGMHLVIATQRPSVDVITGLIKANIPSRIAFTVSNQIDSRTILDMMGAEKLLGRGDMLYLPVGASKPVRIQGAYISDKEVEHIVEYIKSGYDVEYDEDIIEKIESGDKPESDDDGGCDDLLNKAIEIVVDSGQASVSLIQRRLKVGYARAGRIVDQMEARGVIGPHEGSKPRQVILSKTQFYEMMMNTDNAEA